MPASRSSSDGPEGRFSFFHPKVKVKKTISLTSFVFWGLVGLKVLINCKSFQGLLTNVVFFTQTLPPPTHAARGGVAKKWKPWSKMHFKSFEAFLANVVFLAPPILPEGGGVLFDYSVNPVLPFKILNSQRVGIPSFHL